MVYYNFLSPPSGVELVSTNCGVVRCSQHVFGLRIWRIYRPSKPGKSTGEVMVSFPEIPIESGMENYASKSVVKFADEDDASESTLCDECAYRTEFQK